MSSSFIIVHSFIKALTSGETVILAELYSSESAAWSIRAVVISLRALNVFSIRFRSSAVTYMYCCLNLMSPSARPTRALNSSGVISSSPIATCQLNCNSWSSRRNELPSLLFADNFMEGCGRSNCCNDLGSISLIPSKRMAGTAWIRNRVKVALSSIIGFSASCARYVSRPFTSVDNWEMSRRMSNRVLL